MHDKGKIDESSKEPSRASQEEQRMLEGLSIIYIALNKYRYQIAACVWARLVFRCVPTSGPPATEKLGYWLATLPQQSLLLFSGSCHVMASVMCPWVVRCLGEGYFTAAPCASFFSVPCPSEVPNRTLASHPWPPNPD